MLFNSKYLSEVAVGVNQSPAGLLYSQQRKTSSFREQFRTTASFII